MTALAPVLERPALVLLPGGRGRPSLSKLGEMRALIEDLRDELSSSIEERRTFAADMLADSRRAQVLLANGRSPATLLDEMERAAIREGIRALNAGVDDDGSEVA